MIINTDDFLKRADESNNVDMEKAAKYLRLFLLYDQKINATAQVVRAENFDKAAAVAEAQAKEAAATSEIANAEAEVKGLEDAIFK